MPAAASLRIGGLSPHSSCDWPGQLVATVFAQGCPWACAYCHNPHLLPARGSDEIAWEEVLTFLRTRQGLLDGVVFSGGEPTLQDALLGAIADVRELGFQVGLHTGGQFPERLARVLPLVDWLGFDVKAPWDDYDRITAVAGSGASARASLALVVASGVSFEARTTVHPALLSPNDLSMLAEELQVAGVHRYAVQGFRPRGCVGDLPLVSLSSGDFPLGLGDRFEHFEVRDS
ncbi:MAG: anaerobic ribonucleoside-triphosphate reductase activating protein [Coriobacteriia bacterium]